MKTHIKILATAFITGLTILMVNLIGFSILGKLTDQPFIFIVVLLCIEIGSLLPVALGLRYMCSCIEEIQ